MEEPILLQSGAPIPTKTGWTRWPYIISLLLVAASGAGILGLIGVFLVEHFQMNSHKDKMRKMKFKFIGGVSGDDIYNKIFPSLTQKFGDKVQFDREGDTISVKYDSIIYDINLQGDDTFCVWWRKSFAGAFFSFNEWKEYRKIRQGTALIAYEVQHAFEVV